MFGGKWVDFTPASNSQKNLARIIENKLRVEAVRSKGYGYVIARCWRMAILHIQGLAHISQLLLHAFSGHLLSRQLILGYSVAWLVHFCVQAGRLLSCQVFLFGQAMSTFFASRTALTETHVGDFFLGVGKCAASWYLKCAQKKALGLGSYPHPWTTTTTNTSRSWSCCFPVTAAATSADLHSTSPIRAAQWWPLTCPRHPLSVACWLPVNRTERQRGSNMW